jgi:single-stranded DNA-binding protein
MIYHFECGIKVADFGIEVSNNSKEPDCLKNDINFVDVKVFGELIEAVLKDFARDRRVRVEGSLSNEHRDAESRGSKDQVAIVADTIEFYPMDERDYSDICISCCDQELQRELLTITD